MVTNGLTSDDTKRTNLEDFGDRYWESFQEPFEDLDSEIEDIISEEE